MNEVNDTETVSKREVGRRRCRGQKAGTCSRCLKCSSLTITIVGVAKAISRSRQGL